MTTHFAPSAFRPGRRTAKYQIQMDDSQIAEAFVRIFRSLNSVPRTGRVLGVQLSSVPPSCQPKCLIVLRSDSDDLTLTSIIRKTWVIDASGIRIATTSPLPKEMNTNDEHLACPTLKFSTNGKLIRYGLNCGDHWYYSFEAPMASFADDDDTIEMVFDSTSQLGR